MSESSRFDSFMGGKLIEQIRKKHGAKILISARDAQLRKVDRIPTGIFFLDYALGGGFPAARTNIIWGHKSTGKTVICLKALANVQKMCVSCYTFLIDGKCECGKFRESVCAFLDVEGCWDEDWARCHGVDPDRLVLSTPEYAEQTLDMIEALIRSGEVDFIVTDSIAFLSPENEIKESTGKSLQAEQARVLGRAIRKFGAALNHLSNRKGRRPTLLFTNQIRMKLGVMYGNPETQSGGLAPGFSATTETKTYGGKYVMDENTGKPLYVDLSFRIEKNKSYGPRVEGTWRMILADTKIHKKGDVYEEPAMVDMALRLGLVEKAGKSDVMYLGKTYKTKEGLVKKLIKDSVMRAEFVDSLRSVLRV